MSEAPLHDVVVIGAGPAGLAAALALARLDLDVALIASAEPRGDARTTALLGGSVDLMVNLGVWPLIADHAEPLTGIRIVDDRGGLLRAPDVLFRAHEIGAEKFGVNVANAALVAGLWSRVRATPAIAVHLGQAVATIIAEGLDARLIFADETCLRARLVVGADGRNSIARMAAGIAAQTWSYPQSALVTAFEHDKSHAGISTEFHRAAGPLTTVPIRARAGHLASDPGWASSLVWVDQPDNVTRIQALDDLAFLSELRAHLHGLLGRLSGVTARATFPLSGLAAQSAAGNRIALVGEAAHVIPPIGAQGLNLGLRDAAALADCVSDGLAAGEETGGADMLARYQAARRLDVTARVTAVDMLNRSLLSDILPVQAARGIGLHLLANSQALRRSAMHGGLDPIGARPRLMRPQSWPAKT